MEGHGQYSQEAAELGFSPNSLTLNSLLGEKRVVGVSRLKCGPWERDSCDVQG